MKILPALLEATIDSFAAQLTRLTPHFDRFSIDIQDGKVIPSTTISTSDILEYFKSQPPVSASPIFDFDLMTLDYEKALSDISELKKYISIGNIVIFKAALKGAHLPSHSDLVIGLSLDPPDTIEGLELEYNLNQVPCLQIMTIHAGPQGQSFIPELLNKIDQAKSLGYGSQIYIDGAVNSSSLPTILGHKNVPDFACVGSYLTKAGDELEERITFLKTSLREV
ncbi:MAG: hypothetical protein ABIO02_02845 [Patescibacteria group bacterium]